MKKSPNTTNKIAPVLALVCLIFIWHVVTEGGFIPHFMLPTPAKVAAALIDDFPLLLRHAAVTLTEAFWGLTLGITLAFLLAGLMDRFDMLYHTLYPLLVVSQTVPSVCVAPLLVLWMGFGMTPKIALVVLTTFFPITISLLDGYRAVDADAVVLLRSMGAGRWQIFRYIKLPSSIGRFFAGLRVSASYAVIGAVIAEWLGGFEGLGVYMTRVRKAYAFDKMFSVIIFTTVVSLLLMLAISLLRRLCMPWDREDDSL